MARGVFDGQYITEIRGLIDLMQATQAILPTIQANRAELGMSAAEVAELTATYDECAAAFEAAMAAKLELKAALTNQDAAHQAMLDAIRGAAKKWRANKSIPDAMLSSLMVAPHKPPRSRVPAVTPPNFQATMDAVGTAKLRWSRQGNASITIFHIERRDSPSAEWRTVGSTQRTTATVACTPGRYVAFRVRAARNRSMSGPTAPAILYPDSLPSAA